MTTKQLLSSNSYIQYPRFLGNYIGVNEAVLLSAFCDKDNWCEFNIQNYDGWFYYLRDEIELETGLSESQQRTALKSLSDLSIISTKRAGIPSKVYYKLNIDVLENVLNDAQNAYKAHKSQWSQNMTTSGIENMTTCDIENRISTIDKNKNIKINNKSTGTGALTKHPRNFSKEKLTDDLASGEIIDEQKKEKKKSSEYDKCLVMIDKRYNDSNLYMALLNHLEWSYNSKDPKRIKTAKIYSKRLDELDKLEGDKIKIVQQSIEKQWHCFYEIQKSEKRYGNTVDNTILTRQTLSSEEVKQKLAGYAERNGII